MSFSVDVEVPRGDRDIDVRFDSDARLIALFGPSGSGKTTVLQCIAGLLRPRRGRISVGGDILFDSKARIDLPPERRACGYIFQDGRLFPHMNVQDNLLYGWKRAQPERRQLAMEEAVEFLGIGHLLQRTPATLSGGEAQRIAIGRALLSGPRLLLMDEPLSFLDAARSNEIMVLIERIRDDFGVPILYVSHDRAEVDRLAETVITIG